MEESCFKENALDVIIKCYNNFFPEVQSGAAQTNSTISMLHFFHVALISCCTFSILKNIENKQKTKNTIKKRPYTQHCELV